MSDEKKVAKGGFRANLALVISIIALIMAIVAFTRTGGQPDLDARVEELQTRMDKMREETTERVNKIRQETKKALEKVGIGIRKE
jgi:hypothetical protein